MNSAMGALLPLPANYSAALKLIDAAHAEDPKKVTSKEGGHEVPYELHYAEKMTRWLAFRCPDAGPVLQVACRAQHFRRWEIPRDSYPMTRPGYLTWRSKLKSQAAQQVGALLTAPASGIDPAIPPAEVERVAALIRKENLARDEDAQVVEDVACLVFLDDQFDGFEQREEMDEEKVVGILKKTWAKMSSEGRKIALNMELSERARELIGRALEP